MKRLSYSIGTVLLFASILFVINLFVNPMLDPDLGWHFRTGSLILQTKQILEGNSYSYTLPQYPWREYSWLASVFLFSGVKYFGFLLCSIFLFGPCLLLIFLQGTFSGKKISLSFLIAFLFALFPLNSFLGLRTQTFTFIAVGLLLLILENIHKRPNLVYSIPFLFLLWANLHGGFLIGFGMVFLFLLFEVIVQKFPLLRKNPLLSSSPVLDRLTVKRLFLISLLSVGACCINPYGPKLFSTVFTLSSDFIAMRDILEWTPAFFDETLLVYMGLSFALIGLNFLKKTPSVRLSRWGITTVLFFMAYLSRRHIPLFLISGFPLFVGGVESIFEFLSRKPVVRSLGVVCFAVAVMVFSWWSLANTKPWEGSYSYDALVAAAGYPVDAVSYVKEYKPAGNMFNTYNRGSYLLFALPEYKTFIDGRMCSWKENGTSILEEYLTVEKAENGWEVIAKKYDVSWMLLDKNALLAKTLLQKKEWEKVYDDSDAVIFIRKDNELPPRTAGWYP